MDNPIPCAAVRDLLPLYTEQMLSPETTALVEAHLAACPTCAAALAGMTPSTALPSSPAHATEAKPLRRFRWQLLINILSAPLWLPLAIALAATVLILYAALWVVVAALWSIPIALGTSALALLAVTVLALLGSEFAAALMLFAVSLICAGLTILTLLACLCLSRGLAALTSLIFRKFTRNKEVHA